MTDAASSDAPVRRGLLGWMESTTELCGRPVQAMVLTARRLLSFGLIVLATTLAKWNRARPVVHPLIVDQVRRAGVGLLPFAGLLAVVSGFVLIGQAVLLLRQIGAEGRLGTLLAFALVRELAPLAAAFLVLLRVGTSTVVELATVRAKGEVEALEALSIDPVHFLVVPRFIGLAVATSCLTTYFLLGALGAGYFACFIQQVALTPGEFLGQIGRALTAMDFVLLIVKPMVFGGAIAVITCYQGLARPLSLEQVPAAATRAVSQGVVVCVLIDVLVFLATFPS